tara:strand:+ start:141 stop:845 length:705 start_codon:yes stop_codon:yes gene_type:complete
MVTSYYRISFFLFLLLSTSFLLSLLVQQAIVTLELLSFSRSSNQGNMTSIDFLLIISTQALTFIFVFWVGFSYLRLKAFPWGKLPSPSLFFKSFLGLIVVNLLSQGLLNQLGLEINQFANLNKEILLKDLWAFLIAVALIAPLYEEFIFRSLMLGPLSYDSSLGRQLFAIFWINAVFSIFHFETAESWGVLLPVFFLGCYFSFLTIKTGSIALASTLHISQNFFSGLALLYGPT